MELDTEDDTLVRIMATELTDLMAKLTTDVQEKTAKVKTTANIKAKTAAFLKRNTIDRKNQALGDKMDQGNDDDKITNIVDKRVAANLSTKEGKEKEKERAMQKNLRAASETRRQRP